MIRCARQQQTTLPNFFLPNKMTFTKKQLANAYVTHLVENMDLSDLMSYAYDHIQKHLEDYTVEELVAEVEDSAPDVLADLVEEIGATK